MIIEEWLGKENNIGIDIWKRKYQYKDESFDDWVYRVSAGDEKVMDLIYSKKFLFGGRILANRGLYKDGRKISYSNCYVISQPEDSLESIFETSSKLARTYSYGGGCGIDISKLAPKGAKVRNAAKETSGAISFMDLFSLTTELIGQNGRRGALMISMSVDHPDIIDFIKVKTDLNRVTKANISIRVSNNFMEAVVNDDTFKLHYTREATGEVIERTVKARDIMHLMSETNWDYGEPGMLFWDRISNYNLLSTTPKFEYAGTNPCFTGDTLIPIKVDDELKYVTIKSLVGKRPEVYCKDSNGATVTRQADRVCRTRKDSEVVRIIFKNGSYLKCTPDHLFYVDGRNWVMAKDIVSDTQLFSGIDDQTYIVQQVHTESELQDVYDISVPGLHNFFVVPSGQEYHDYGVLASNCGEEPLPAGGSCLLGSINLSEFVIDAFKSNARFDFDSFSECVRLCVRALNDVLDEGLPLHPLQEQRDSVSRWRQIGLGIMGLADMLIKLGIRYGSKESLDICNQIGTIMANCAIHESSMIAKEQGKYPEYVEEVRKSSFYTENIYKYTQIDDDVVKYGMRNSQLLTIAPTGTLSTMLGISGGIEPIFSFQYTRKTESLYGRDKYYNVNAKIVDDFLCVRSEYTADNLPDYFVDAMTIDYSDRVSMQSTWQKHIDASISSTVNVPEDFKVEDVERMYIEAWEKGCKGITLFRNNCKRLGILTTEPIKDKNLDEYELRRGEILEVSDNVIGLKRKLMTGCGTLHCEAFFDPNTGNLLETYLSKGSTGGCNNFMIGLSRMISISARGGVPLKDILDQLNSTGACPSYVARRAKYGDTSKGSCCPMAVGNALLDMSKQINSNLSDYSKIISNNVKTHHESLIIIEDNDATCPECGSILTFEGGCNICKNCGYSRCS